VVAAFGDLDVGGGAGGGEDAGGGVGVEEVGELCSGSVPGLAGEAAGGFAGVAFGAGGGGGRTRSLHFACGSGREDRVGAGGLVGVGDVGDVGAGVGEAGIAVGGAGLGEGAGYVELGGDVELGGGVEVGQGPGVLGDGGGGAGDERLGVGGLGVWGKGLLVDGGVIDQAGTEDAEVGLDARGDAGLDGVWREDVERAGRVGLASGVPGGEAGGGQDAFELAGAEDGVDLRDVFADLVAVALDEAAGDDDALGLAAVLLLVLDHLEDGVDGLLLGGVDEGAGVDDDDFGVFGAGCEVGAVVVEQAHHDFGVDEVFGQPRETKPTLGRVGAGVSRSRVVRVDTVF